MFRSSAPPASSRANPSGLRGPSGTVIPGTAPVPDFARPSMRTPVARSAREASPALRRLNKCMFLEYDEREHRWRDALNRTGRVERAAAPRKPRREADRVAVAGPDVALPALPIRPPIWENPLMVGLLLAICPPVGVTLAWSARSIPHSGRVALTMFGAFVMLTATLVACLLLT